MGTDPYSGFLGSAPSLIPVNMSLVGGEVGFGVVVTGIWDSPQENVSKERGGFPNPYAPWDWYIYLHLVDFYGINVGQYAILGAFG